MFAWFFTWPCHLKHIWVQVLDWFNCLPVFTLPVFSFASQYQYWLCYSCSHGKGLGTTVCKNSIVSIELMSKWYSPVSFWSVHRALAVVANCTALISTPSLPMGALCPPPTSLHPNTPHAPCNLRHACDIVLLVMAEEYWWFCSCDTTHPAL